MVHVVEPSAFGRDIVEFITQTTRRFPCSRQARGKNFRHDTMTNILPGWSRFIRSYRFNILVTFIPYIKFVWFM